jgi:hypothetical protein
MPAWVYETLSQKQKGWIMIFMIGHLSNMCKVLGSIISTAKKKKKHFTLEKTEKYWLEYFIVLAD